MDQQPSVEALRQIDAACDQFEAEWRKGGQPQLEDFVRRADPALRSALLEALQKLQQELILGQLGEESVLSDPEALPAAPSPPAAAPRGVPSAADPAAMTLNWDGPRVILEVVAGPHQGRQFIYDEHDTLLVGRSSHAQLRLNEDPHFSRHHFRLEVNPPTCFLMDLRSRNGTFVNGERVTERYLVDGDLVSGGRTKMKVLIRAPHAGSSAPRPASRAQPEPAPVAKAARPAAGAPALPAFAAAASREPADGDVPVVNGYRIHEQLGAGDLGRVFRATRLADGATCALKVMTPAGRHDEQRSRNFLREVSILNQLQHPHIVRMIEMGASGGDLFLSTEFLPTVRWGDLSALWPAERRIRIACGLIAQILSALEYAHGRELVHRDVKPGNVLIYRTEGKLAAKLADFGLAKQYTTAGMSQMTREGDVIGSLPFMSPEQFVNSREARPGCDIYSAGATLYWMLTGGEPIALENHSCKFLAILEDPPVPLAQRCPEAPAGLASLVHRALEKAPEKRFASAAEFRQQLRAFAK